MRRACLVMPAIALAVALPRVARAQGAMCVNSATGVPDTYGQPPQDWWTFGSPTTVTPNDPRWVGASGHSLSSGTASSPVELRSVWASVGGQNYVYLSWQFFVDTDLEETTHALYVAFQVGSDTQILRYAFRNDSSTAAVQYCNEPQSCTFDASYTQYQPMGQPPVACSGIPDLGTAQRFIALDSPTITWADDTARYWREDWVGTRDRWTVQIRIPVDGTPSLDDGLPEGAKISYQATLESAVTPGELHYEPWPRESTRPVQFCLRNVTPSQIILDNPARFRTVSLTGLSPAPAEGCSGAVRVEQLGVVDPSNPSGPFITTMDTDGQVNLAARIVNETANPIAIGALTAHFRMADWGAQSWNGAWSDVPFSGSGLAPGEVTNAVAVPAKDPTTMVPGTADVVLGPWTLTPEQRCQYTWWQGRYGGGWPATAECGLCDDPNVPGVDQLGAQWRGGACLPGKQQHQCTAVELRGGDLDWQRRSVYNNLDFAPLTVDAREALIDTRGLPTAKGQKEHEIYFVVMPRNMPSSRTETTYAKLIGQAAQTIVEQIIAEGGPAPQDDNENDDGEHDDGGNMLHGRLPQMMMIEHKVDERIEQLPGRVRQEAALLDQIADYLERMEPQNPDAPKNEQIVDAIASAVPTDTLAHLVPSLEVYVYYTVSSKEAGTALLPMTSFTLVTHHDGPVAGTSWALDGTEHVGGNVYRKVIPTGKVGRVRVRLQAAAPGESLISPDEDWPCGCTCGGKTCTSAVASNAGLLTLAFLWANRRRRRRRDEPAL